jgi:hypothetical protein
MRTASLTAAALATLALALPATAQATTSRSATCTSATVDGVRVDLTTMGAMSCAMARETAHKVALLGRAPSRLRITSPITHRTYTLRRDSLESDAGYWSVVYLIRSNVGVQLQTRF